MTGGTPMTQETTIYVLHLFKEVAMCCYSKWRFWMDTLQATVKPVVIFQARSITESDEWCWGRTTFITPSAVPVPLFFSVYQKYPEVDRIVQTRPLVWCSERKCSFKIWSLELSKLVVNFLRWVSNRTFPWDFAPGWGIPNHEKSWTHEPWRKIAWSVFHMYSICCSYICICIYIYI